MTRLDLLIATEGGPFSAILQVPSVPTALLVLAHGAGAGMAHPFMATVADGFAEREIATLRFNFPYMEQGSRRPDRAPVAQAAVRAAVADAGRHLPGLPLLAGGKSSGGRMTSQAQAETPLRGVRGLVFLGFPLHPANKPSIMRAAHLSEIKVPMFFVQGTRDALADPALVAGATAGLGERATLRMVEGMDHAFHVPKRSGRSDADVLAAILDAVGSWIAGVVAAG